MSNDQVTNQYIGERELVEEIFLDAHGKDREKSVSVATENRDGTLYRQIPAGNVLGKYEPDGLHYPLVYDEAQGDVSDDNEIEVGEARNFREGDYVELPTDVADDTTRFRQVEDVNLDDDTITLDGSSFSLSEDDPIEVDPTRSFATVATTASAPGDSPTTVELEDGQAERFEVGDIVEIDDQDDLEVVDVDDENDTIDVDADIGVEEGDLVVSEKRGQYKIPVKTVNTSHSEYTPRNVLARCRDHGEVREDNLRGLTPDAKSELEPLITFNQRWS